MTVGHTVQLALPTEKYTGTESIRAMYGKFFCFTVGDRETQRLAVLDDYRAEVRYGFTVEHTCFLVYDI